jgi:IS1 family transposase
MPATGKLAEIARRKYPPRRDERAEKSQAVLSCLERIAPQKVPILTDQWPAYPHWIRATLPEAKHSTVKGRRGCVVGQGELKRGGFDPLFSLNHTAAMLRANVNRLHRRTWCTTKRMDRLELHLWLYVNFHNETRIKESRSRPPSESPGSSAA